MSVMHTNGVDLLFITLDTMRGTNVISEKPGLCLRLSSEEGVGLERVPNTGDEGTHSI